MNATSHEDLKEEMMGPIGTPRRDKYEIKSLMWRIGRFIAGKRKDLSLSQEELAQRVGLPVREIKRMERTAIRISIPITCNVMRELGICYNGKFLSDAPNFTLKPKPIVKNKLTKQSPSLRTLVR
jgi:HTH-type transcriptional regulator/antitoxin HipB